jgi:uncharacterized membrane protein YgcG
MRCPSCGIVSPIGSENCQSCGFVAASLADRLGQDAVLLDRLIDAAHCLRLRDRTRLEAALDDFERRFPQLVVCAYFGVLPQGVTAAEAAVWLCENGVRQRESGNLGGMNALVLAVDPAAHVLGIAVGAGLAIYLPQAFAEDCLRHEQFQLWHGEYAAGVVSILDRCSKKLMAAAEARRRSVSSSPKPRLGLDRMGAVQPKSVAQASEKLRL